MAHEDDDVETQSGPNENTSLLAGEQPDHSPQEQQVNEKKSTHWVLWRIVWALVAALVLVVFIKGWIDADGDVNFDLKAALRKALGGGLSGAAAMVLQVLLLMPLRTIMNYQYRFGTSFSQATQILYADGGLGRYYSGIGAALIQGPVARFGDTAANAGILALLQSNSYLKNLPSLAKTVFASLCAAGFRMILTPVDTLKTTLQAQGSHGTALLRKRIKEHGIGTLWWGAFATAGATFVGHYPWFATYNLLTEAIKEPPKSELFLWLLRLAFIGFIASIISDSVSNSLRVIKTYRQVNDTKVSYGKSFLITCLFICFSGCYFANFFFLSFLECRRGRAAGGSGRRSIGAAGARPEDTHLEQRPAGTSVFHFVEALFGSLGTQDKVLMHMLARAQGIGWIGAARWS